MTVSLPLLIQGNHVTRSEWEISITLAEMVQSHHVKKKVLKPDPNMAQEQDLRIP